MGELSIEDEIRAILVERGFIVARFVLETEENSDWQGRAKTFELRVTGLCK